MQVFRAMEAIPAGPCVMSVGNFDGAHIAHRSILGAVVAEARARGRWAAALTFSPHPARLLHPDSAPALLTTEPDKIARLAATGLDWLLILPFTAELAAMPPREFVQHLLLRRLGMASLHEGDDFRFGRRQSGQVADLRRWAPELGFDLRIHPAIRLRGHMVSSSQIRQFLAAGNISGANRMLGYCYRMQGSVVGGRGIGRRLTVPTLNLQYQPEQALPGRGVYISYARIQDRAWPALTNIGIRPSFADAGGALTVETYLLPGHAAPLTSSPEELTLEFLHFLRPEHTFPSPEALRAQISADTARAQNYFGKLQCAGIKLF